MTPADVAALTLIALVAVIAPLLAETTRRFGIPGVVMEIGLGIIIGPGVLHLVSDTAVVGGFANLGLTMLMFLAGYELELSRVAGRPIMLAGLSWALSLVLAAGLGLLLLADGVVRGDLLLCLALTTTALGTLLPALRDSGALATGFGRQMLAVGSVGEFGPIVLVAVLFGTGGDGETIAVLLGFAVLVVAFTALARRRRSRRVNALLARGLRSSSQLPVRITILLIATLVLIAVNVGLDILLGAFAAGVIVRLAVGRSAHTPDGRVFEAKLEAIGFGVFVPIFFVVSGVRFDLDSFLESPSTLLRIPLFLGLLLVVRGLPVLLCHRQVLPAWRERVSLAVLSATGLPLIVVITTLGTGSGLLGADDAAGLVGAGMLSVLLFPALGLRLLRGLPGIDTSARQRGRSSGSEAL